MLHNQSVINDKFSKYFMAEKDSLKEEVVELREENHILSGKLGTAEARVVEKSKIVDELNATIKGLHDAMHDLVIKHEVEKKSIVDVTIDEQMAVSNEAIKVLSAVLQDTQNEMTKRVADIRELYGTNHKYSEHIVELKEELAVVTDRYDRCKEDLDHCKSSQLALGNKVDELKDQLVRKDLEFEGAKLRIHEEALKMDSSENNAMIRMMSDNLKDSHAEMAMKEEEIKTLVVNITKLEAELIGKNNRISELGQQRAIDANEYRTRTNDAITALNNTLLDLKQQLSHSFEENHILLGKFHQLEVELASSNTRCTEYVLSIDAHKRQIQDLKDTILELRVTIEQNRIKFEGEKQVLLENLTSKNSESLFERVESKLSHLNSSIEQINATTVTLHRNTENRLSRRVGNIIVSGIFHNNVRELYDKYCFYFFVGVACLLTYYCWSMNFFLDMYQPSTHTGGDSATNVGSYDPDDVGVNFDSIFSSDDRIGSSNSKFTFGRNNIKYI